MVQSATQQPSPLVEDVTVKDAFSDFCIGISLVGTNLHMTFGSVTADHTKPTAPPTRVVSAKIGACFARRSRIARPARADYRLSGKARVNPSRPRANYRSAAGRHVPLIR